MNSNYGRFGLLASFSINDDPIEPPEVPPAAPDPSFPVTERMRHAQLLLQQSYKTRKDNKYSARDLAQQSFGVYAEVLHRLNYGNGVPDFIGNDSIPAAYLQCIECMAHSGECKMRIAQLDCEEHMYDHVFDDAFRPAIGFIQRAQSRVDSLCARLLGRGEEAPGRLANELRGVAESIEMVLGTVSKQTELLRHRREELVSRLDLSCRERESAKASMGENWTKKRPEGKPLSSYAELRASLRDEVVKIDGLLKQIDSCNKELDSAKLFVEVHRRGD